MHIRPAKITDAAAIAKVHVDSWRTTYKGIVPDDFLSNLSHEQRERFWCKILLEASRTNFVYIAEDDRGNIVGFASGGPERSGGQEYTGELYAIYLLDTHQRQGIGRELTATLVKRLIQEGMNSLVLWVLAENPARGFYERLGGHPVYERPIRIGDVQLIEVGYGWMDAGMIFGD